MRKALALCLFCVLSLASVGWGKIGGGDVSFLVKEGGSVVFSHDNHVGKVGLRCAGCHQALSIDKMNNKATMADMKAGKYCGACHDGKKAFTVASNCERCHRK